MKTAKDFQNQLTPVCKVENPSPKRHSCRSEEAVQVALEWVQKATDANCGGVVLFIDGVLEQYNIVEREKTNYLESKVVNSLKELGFEVREKEDMGDGSFYLIQWDKDFPTFTLERKTHFYLHLPV